MVNLNEVISLVVLTISFFLMIGVLLKVSKWKYILIAYSIGLVSILATVLEDFFAPVFMNYLEHVSWMISAIVFCFVGYKFTRESMI